MGNAVCYADVAGNAAQVCLELSGRALASCQPELPGPGKGRRDGRFLDEEFPPTEQSLGTPKPGRQFVSEEKLANVRWIRLPELLRMNGWVQETDLAGDPRLDWDSVDPGDLAQGRLGNCWLVASLAALAEFPEAVRDLFVEADVAAGRYVVRLYDMGKAKWDLVEVDDFIPCSHETDWAAVQHIGEEDGKRVYKYEDIYNSQGLLKVPGIWEPIFGRPKGSQVWALLLEKAVAKFVGSYALLAGGSEPYALTAFTGFPLVYCFTRPATDAAETSAGVDSWQWRGAQYLGRETTGHCYTKVPGAPDSLTNCRMWAKLLEFDARNFLMTASITKFREPETQADFIRKDGLVLGHAYSLLSGKCAMTSSGKMAHLVLLRNPHGKASPTPDGMRTSEWNGKWSHGSPSWKEHPEVALQVGYEPSNDGVFWMSWEDFRQTFDKVCVLAKSMARCPAKPARATAAPPGGFSVSIGLDRMADEAMRADLRQLSVTFDPFAHLPEFLDDGSLDTRLLWEATKPGRVQAYLDVNRGSGNEAGYRMILDKVTKLGLTAALGHEGCISGLPAGAAAKCGA